MEIKWEQRGSIEVYEYNCKLDRVIDGDTVDVDIDLGFNHWIHGERIRLFGIDTPESRTSDKVEKRYGLLAKEFVQSFFEENKTLTLQTKKKDKYGRYLGVIKSEEISLNAELVSANMAVPYTGQNKAEIKIAHLLNRERLNETQT